MLIQYGLALRRNENAYETVPLDLRVEGGRITACGVSLSALPGEECFSARGLLLLPGLVNAHVHSYTNLLKGTAFGEPLELWGLGTVALGGILSPEEMALSAQLGIAEMLRHGMTACIDHIPHAAAVYPIAETYRAAGFRAALAPMLHDCSDHLVLEGMERELPVSFVRELRQAAGMPIPERIVQYEQWIRDLHRPDELVRMLVGINAPQRCTRPLLEAAGILAEKYGMGIHMHLLETAWQADSGLGENENPVEKAGRAGLLHQKTSLAHCVYLTKEQIDRVAAAGATVVHNPTSNLFLGSGVLPLGWFRSNGVRVAFGSDGCNCATGHNLLEIARTALLLERSYQRDPALWQPLADWYDGLTRFGWGAMGVAQPQAGTLEVSAPADIIFCDLTCAGLIPAVDLSVQFLINQSAPDVRHVMIGGKFALRDKQILCLDEPALYSVLREKSPCLRKKFKAALAGTAQLRPAYERAYRKRLEQGRYRRPSRIPNPIRHRKNPPLVK